MVHPTTPRRLSRKSARTLTREDGLYDRKVGKVDIAVVVMIEERTGDVYSRPREELLELGKAGWAGFLNPGVSNDSTTACSFFVRPTDESTIHPCTPGLATRPAL